MTTQETPLKPRAGFISHYGDYYTSQRAQAFWRDGHRCRFPGCTIRNKSHSQRRKCSMHHIIKKEHGGTDDRANLVTLCPFHHCLVHQLWG